MKTHTIKTPTAELLIIEPPQSWGLVIGEEALLIYDHTKKVFGKTHTFNGHYTILGRPDEISEEDARELVEAPEPYWDDNKNQKVIGNAKWSYAKSLLSLLESEIYWENPFANDVHAPDIEEWKEAEQETFDRNRSIIFNKKI